MNGYTYQVGCGKVTATKDYLMRIIRAFGVTTNMRDMSMDIPATEELVVDNSGIACHRQHMNAARRKLYRLKKLDAKGWLELARPHLGYTNPWEDLDDSKIANRRLGDMLLKVRAWQPAAGQEEVKALALKQLKDALSFGSYRAHSQQPTYQSALAYRHDTLKHAQQSFNYHRRELRRVMARNSERVQFLRDFLASVEGLD